MRKKKGVIITVTTALVIAACGVGCLHAGMEKTMQEEVVTQVESNPDLILEEGSPEESSPEEVENLVCQANQVWQEEESIYLPEGAEIVAQGKDSYGIVWDNYSIEYWQNDKYFAKETQEDLGLGKVVLILKDTIQKYSGQDMGNCEIEVVLADPVDDYEGGEACEPIILETTDGEVLELKTTDGDVHMIIADVEGAANVREYENDARCYQVGVSFDKHDYFICVDSVTGEVLQYYYQNSNLGDYSHGWGKIFSYDAVEYELSEEEQKEYDAMIASFVTNDLKLGNVEKVFARDWGLAELNNGSIGDARAYYSAICKTDNGTMVEISVDMGEKMVVSFDTTIVYSSEG